MKEETMPVDDAQSKPLDVEAVRQRLTEAKGPRYWRSLSELAGTPEFEELVHREFPRHASEWPEGFSRRGFLELSAASLALAGLTACTRQPEESIVPYVKQPEDIVPGKPLYYATAHEVGGYAQGLLVESHMGRPTKVEGNPEHPASLGATDAFSQAAILGLYDPDRSQVATKLGRVATWSQFVDELKARLPALTALGGEGLAVLTGTVTSPTLGAQLQALGQKLPQARWHQYEPAGPHSARAAAREAFGSPVHTRYDFSQADVIVALDADFLTQGPGAVRAAREFGRRRKAARSGQAAAMNRLYCVESSPTVSAAQADHRLALPPEGVAAFAAALAAEVGVGGAAGATADANIATWAKAVGDDLKAHRSRGAVIAGECAPPAVHVLAHAINEALGNFGTAVILTEPVEAQPEDQLASIAALTEAMKAGKVDTLLILGGNPVYDAPAELGFAAALGKVGFRVHLSLYDDETSAYCQWHLAGAHAFEAWGDSRSLDGTVTLIQPLIAPLYGGKTSYDVLALFGDTTDASAFESVRAHWQKTLPANGAFEAAWRRAVHDGFLAESTAPAATGIVSVAAVAKAAATAREARPGHVGMTLLFRPDPTIFDGRFANNGWLQELPKPLTRLTWDNALMLSPRDAATLGVKSEELVEMQAGGLTLAVPAWVLPGHADGCATLHLGYGRSRAGRVGSGCGVDAYPLRTSAEPWARHGVTVRKADGKAVLASTQEHFDIEQQSEEAAHRHLVRHGSLADFAADPAFAQHMGHGAPGPDKSLYPPHPYTGNSWGMAVDLSACTGCNACVVACQSENNIAVVGKEQVRRGREMHWIRIDRYFEGDLHDPGVHHQPVMCMHCELAPCEVVCPVAATVHGPEGLNEMVYNRCVGTRYCSNNCPYKVRRFNFLLYSDFETEVLKMARNPDVTVRSRGVMEKCSYCVQRINHARIDAKRDGQAGRAIRDGEIVTACQQACPAEAIVFGNLNDPEAEVNRWKASPLNYGLIEDLGTRPRTTYLAKLSNPNPALAAPGGAGGHEAAGAHDGGHA